MPLVYRVSERGKLEIDCDAGLAVGAEDEPVDAAAGAAGVVVGEDDGVELLPQAATPAAASATAVTITPKRLALDLLTLCKVRFLSFICACLLVD